MTAEEKAKEYANQTSGGFAGTVMENLIAEIFTEGANWQAAQMGWRPISELPDKLTDGIYSFMNVNGDILPDSDLVVNSKMATFYPAWIKAKYTHFIILPDKPVK